MIKHKFHRIGEASTMNMVCSSHLQRCQTSIWNVSKKIEMSFIDSSYIFHIHIYIFNIYSIIHIYIYSIYVYTYIYISLRCCFSFFDASKDCCCSFFILSSPLVSRTQPDGSPAPNHRCLFCMASRWTLPRAANGAEAGAWPCKAGSHGHESPEEIIIG